MLLKELELLTRPYVGNKNTKRKESGESHIEDEKGR